MDFTVVSNIKTRKKADIIILPFWKGKQKAEAAGESGHFQKVIAEPVNSNDFKGKCGETLMLYLDKEQETRLLLCGLGEKEKASVEMLRRSFGAAGKACLAKSFSELNVVLPELKELSGKEVVRGVVEGLLLVNYAFENHKTTREFKPVKKAHLIGAGKDLLNEAKKYAHIAEGVYVARDLSNGNADEVTSQHLAKVAKEIARKNKSVKTTVFDKKRIIKEKMGLILAVNRGSHIDPALIIMEYKGNPKSKDTTVIVGKGVTYDTGGLNLKPTGYMETMKSDMSGAAACFGIVTALTKLGLKKNVTIVVPTTENSIAAASYKPGDVYPSYLGKTVEIGNTDAEGRLILADALAYAAKKLKPSRIIDFATLTGAVEVAIGSDATGIMGNSDEVVKGLIEAGDKTFERVWRLPLYEEYRDQIKSDVADIKNIGESRQAGSSIGGIFLQEFVENTPWVHCDIAGTAFLKKEKNHYIPKNATGMGVRLALEYLENL